MENVLEEFFSDAMADAALYNDENFEAFESDEDSMLILGQPIDDQITTKNLPSFAIPQKTGTDGSPGSDEECEYEDSFESPTKSPTHAHPLNEMSSITFMHSKADPTTHEFPPVICEKPKKKGKKKKKRVPPAAALTGTMQQAEQQSVPRKGSAGTNMPVIRTSAVQSQAAVPQSGSRMGVRSRPTPRTVSAGQNGSIYSSAPASGARVVSSGSGRPAPKTVQPVYPPHFVQAQQSSGGSVHAATVASETHHDQHPQNRQGHQSALYQAYNYPPHPQHPQSSQLVQASEPSRPAVGAGAGASSVTSQITAMRHQGAVYTNAVLQRQLDNALKQVAIYRRENEALQHNLDSAGINEAVERYKALLIEKESRIHQLESENAGLKSIARYQSKFLSEQAHQPTGIDSMQSHEKQIEIMLVHTRKMKEKAKRLEQREQELVAENEHLHTQNGRIQRKNLKLRKQVAELSTALQKAGKQGGGAPEQGAISTSILDSLDGADGAAGEADHSPQDSREGLLLKHLQGDTDTSAAANASQAKATESHPPGVSALSTGAAMTKAALRKALAACENQLQKKQQMVEALERSLQSQRGRFMREIEQLKQQVAQGEEERRKLTVELEKRERFGRNQVSTLKQIRAAYDELSSGYRKLLTASELYNRDTAPPQRPKEEPTRPDPVKPLSPLAAARRLAPRAGLLSEHDDTSADTMAYTYAADPMDCGGGESALSPVSSTTLPTQQQHQYHQYHQYHQQHQHHQLQQAPLIPVRPSGSAGSGGGRAGSARQLAASLVHSLHLEDTVAHEGDS